jgi:membrane protein DedA with SNARE-associated domain
MPAPLVDRSLALAAEGGPWTLLGLALATLASEDLACIAAGLLVAQGAISFPAATAACLAGILVGDLALVAAGRWLGARWLDRAPLRWFVTREGVDRASRWLAARGAILIFTTRFLPGTRLPTYVAAGLLRVPFARLALWLTLACALWTPLLVGAAAVFGDTARAWLQTWTTAAPALVLGGLLVWLLARVGLQAATWRGRRLLLSRWRRAVRWEFWPMWAVYPPVVLWITWLGVRVRCLTWFTAVNPGIDAGGGLVGESKSAILRALDPSRAVAPWALIAPGEASDRRTALDAFLAARPAPFPVVLKPDVGERGGGVVIARDRASAEAALDETPGPLIAQAYVPGIEFGVFYVRLPSEARGRIFAITEKRTPALIGDGIRNLETLILADDRAVNMAEFFLRQFAARRDEVPAAGERIPLTDLGTHCRGSLFLDGAHHETPALLAEIERVSRVFDGFHFGRYDVRTPGADAFRRGEFTVIELNGLTSEATSIYDPRHGPFHGWSVLCRQWHLAWRIARETRAAGARTLTAAETIRLARAGRD